MPMQRTLTLPDGTKIEYTLERKCVKNINLRVRPNGEVYVSAPSRVPVGTVDDTVRRNADYISRHRKRAQEREARAHEYDDNSVVQLLSDKVQVVYKETIPGHSRNTHYKLENGVLTIMLKTPDDPIAQARAKEATVRSFAKLAIGMVFEQVYPGFIPYGVKKPEIRMRKMKSCWGSCQPQRGIITFNTALVHADPDCIRYVVVHEFCHFVHPDHSPAFHALMTKLMPDWKTHKKRLNETVIL